MGRVRLRGKTVTKMLLDGAEMVTAAVADLVGSATLVATTETIAGVGTVVGAV